MCNQPIAAKVETPPHREAKEDEIMTPELD